VGVGHSPNDSDLAVQLMSMAVESANILAEIGVAGLQALAPRPTIGGAGDRCNAFIKGTIMMLLPVLSSRLLVAA
jgi:hypothetical protein